jgi:hypothetical protein
MSHSRAQGGSVRAKMDISLLLGGVAVGFVRVGFGCIPTHSREGCVGWGVDCLQNSIHPALLQTARHQPALEPEHLDAVTGTPVV